jgi:hypothetical protein
MLTPILPLFLASFGGFSIDVGRVIPQIQIAAFHGLVSQEKKKRM